MTNYFEIISILCFVALLFGAARFGWVAGFYVYHFAMRLSDYVADRIFNLIKRGDR